MVAFRSLLAAAPLLALAFAQAKIAFSSTPAEISAGDSYNITWGGGDGSGVTLTLRRGNPQDLDTVDTIASNADGYSYLWTVPSSIESGDDYALQITQGQDDINYSGLFSIEGSSSSSSNSTAATTTSASQNSTMAITSAASASGTGTAMQRNSTFSTASLTSSGSTGLFNTGSTTSHSSTRTSSAATQSTSAPSANEAPVRAGSSAALILGIVAAVMLH